MNLSSWIEKNGGTGPTAKLLGVKHNNVFAWKAGTCIPRPGMMKAIVTKSRGKVGYAEIVEGYLDSKAKTAKPVTKGKTAKPAKKAPAKLKGKKKKTVKVDPGF